MGLYRTAIVQGLSSAHGREERRLFCPVFWVFISSRLKDRELSRNTGGRWLTAGGDASGLYGLGDDPQRGQRPNSPSQSEVG